MTSCPKLGRCPGVGNDDLKIKVSASGASYLPQTRYRNRYTGSKKSGVSIHGKLYVDKKDLQKAIDSWKDKGKKKSGCRLSKPEKIDRMEHKDINDIPTAETDLSPLSETLSPKSKIRTYSINKREVRQRILGYINTNRGKKELYFWTVTFPAGTPDAVCYQVYNIWLTSLRKYRMLREYLWIAERQPLQTKTIHFHIAIPHRMDVHRANAMMAGTLKTFSRRGDIPFTEHQCRKYNGVHIAKNKDTKRVINFANKKGSRTLGYYLTKYVTKNDEKFEHLAWHNSRGYSALFTGVTFTIKEFTKMGYNYYLDRTKTRVMEFCVFIPWINGPPDLVVDHLYQLNTFIQESLN